MTIPAPIQPISDFGTPVVFQEIKQELVNYEPVNNVINEVEALAVVQVATAEQLQLVNGYDVSKKYIQVHTQQEIKNNHRCIFNGKKYRAFLIKDFSNYGFFEAYFEQLRGDD